MAGLFHFVYDRATTTASGLFKRWNLSLVSNQYLRTITIVGRPDLHHPDWKQYPSGQPLNSNQVSDMVAWLVSKRPSVPASQF